MNSVQQTSLLTGTTIVLQDGTFANHTSQSQGAQSLLHKPATSVTSVPVSTPQTQTKFVIQRPPSTMAQSVISDSGDMVSFPLDQESPSQTVTSPVKLIQPTTATKQKTIVGKIPISPIKVPSKFTVNTGGSPSKILTTGGGASPRKILTGSGGSLVTLTKHNLASGGTGTLKAVTVSPTKLVIKGNPPQKIVMSSGVTGATGTPAVRSVVPAGVQPLSVAGSKFQYVRLVTSSTPQLQPAAKVIPGPAPRPIVPATSMKVSMATQPQQQQVVSSRHTPVTSYVSSTQRLILPAGSQPVPIQPQPTLVPAVSLAGPNFSNQPGALTPIQTGSSLNLQTFTLVPAQYVAQVPSQPLCVKQEPFVPTSNVAQSATATKALSNGPSSSSADGSAARAKKACNCTKSQCLKLYCDCFANGEFCANCNCNNCYNNLEHEEERSRAIKACLERNPLAFHPKIGKTKAGGGNVRRHNKGCNCKRSGCLKNYCECYEAKILCSNLCKCVGCKNFEESPDRKTLMHLADAAEVRVQQQTAVKTRTEDLPVAVKHTQLPGATSERPAYTFMTEEVIEAACSCLLDQAEEAERTRQNELEQERLILREFGHCLMQVIDAANRTRAPSPV